MRYIDYLGDHWNNRDGSPTPDHDNKFRAGQLVRVVGIDSPKMSVRCSYGASVECVRTVGGSFIFEVFHCKQLAPWQEQDEAETREPSPIEAAPATASDTNYTF